MVNVIYVPESGTPEETTQFGYDFRGGKPTEVTDAKALAKFRGNRFFTVSEPKAEKAPSAVEYGLKGVHHGGGRFVIKNNGEIIKDGLNKADADAFNALSDEDKAEYVK